MTREIILKNQSGDPYGNRTRVSAVETENPLFSTNVPLSSDKLDSLGFNRLFLRGENPASLFNGCVSIGDVAGAVAKDAIMRGYQQGVLTNDEAMDLIAFMGLKHK